MLANPEARRETRRIGAPIQSTRPDHDKYVEMHREIQRLKDEKKAMESQLAVTLPPQDNVTAAPQMTIDELLERDEFIRRVVTEVFKPGVDYGPPFPGSDEVALWQSGANKLTTLFGLFSDPIEVEKVIERAPDSVHTQHIRYEFRCDLHVGSRNGPVVGSAVGVCSSEEDRYKYRTQSRRCPSCGKETIIKGKAEYGGGWICHRKSGGCGAKYAAGDVTIESQQVGKIINPDMMGLQHTIAAMAQKRAFILAVRRTTGVDSYFSEAVAEDEPTVRPATINGTATTRTSAAVWSDSLIKYAESLMPPDHGYSKSAIGKACLEALGIENWSSPYSGTEEAAKKAIAAALNKKMSGTEHRAEVCVKCEKDPRLNDDGPYPFLCAACAREQSDQDAAKT